MKFRLVMTLRPRIATWLAAGALAASAPVPLRGAPQHAQRVACGAPHTVQETLFLHKQRLAQDRPSARAQTLDPPPPDRVGEIALIEATPEILLPPNPLDLTGRRVTIVPGPSGFTITGDALAAGTTVEEAGLPIDIGDDDFAVVELPFPFPYYGGEYTRGFVHSDGNFTFVQADASVAPRSYSRAVTGPPRIAPFFADLDPSRSGRVRMAVVGDRVLLTWYEVPLWTGTGTGIAQTFQLALESDGKIEFRYGEVAAPDGIVGIFPGISDRDAAAVDWSGSESTSVPDDPILAEVFSGERGLDALATARAFFRAHEDAYDTLVLFNDLGLPVGPSSLAVAWPVRNEIEGIGKPPSDIGAAFGSPRRLSTFVNMGAVSDYPASALAPLPGSPSDSLLTVLAHELGHRFLAYAPWRDPETGSTSMALLRPDRAHWRFYFNSGASVLDGNWIRDHGADASPRFETVAATQAYSQLDQYFMGFVDPSEIAATFLVVDPYDDQGPGQATRGPEVGVRFDGMRKEVRIEDIISAAGPRRPDASVAQRHFRYGFLLLVDDAESPDPASIRKLNLLRTYWRMFGNVHFGDKASSATELVKMLHLTTWPAGGVLSGGSGTARIIISEPRDTDLAVFVTAQEPVATVPATVVIPAGQVFAEFRIEGSEPGTTTLTARAADAGYDTAVTRLNVKDGPAGLKLEALHAEELQGVAAPFRLDYRVTDENRVPYSGVGLEFMGSVAGDDAILDVTTDFEGRAGIEWQPGDGEGTQVLSAGIKGLTEVRVPTNASPAPQTPSLDASATVNAASGEGAPAEGGFAPGSLVTIQGADLTTTTSVASALDASANPSLPYELDGTRVHVGGVAVPLVRAAPDQITFQLPFEIAGDSAQLLVAGANGRSDPVTIPLSAAQPGLFPDRVGGPPGTGAEVAAPGESSLTAGGSLYAYGTGLGAVEPAGRTGRTGLAMPPQLVLGETTAHVDGQEVSVSSSKLSSSEAGVYEVVITLPDGLEPGAHTLTVAVDGVESNEVEFASE